MEPHIPLDALEHAIRNLCKRASKRCAEHASDAGCVAGDVVLGCLDCWERCVGVVLFLLSTLVHLYGPPSQIY
jgi:hypothetical protein